MSDNKEDLQTLVHTLEIIFDSQDNNPNPESLELKRQKLHLVYETEKTLALVCQRVNGKADPTLEERVLVRELQDLVIRLKQDALELPFDEHPHLYRNRVTIFGAGFRAGNKNKVVMKKVGRV